MAHGCPDLLAPQEFTKHLARSGILTDPSSIVSMDIRCNGRGPVTARVEYVLDDRFLNPPDRVLGKALSELASLAEAAKKMAQEAGV